MKFWDEFEEKIISNFTQYMLPVIVLKKENTKEAVCQVFEKVNTGGVSLNVFELLTATYASDNFDLREYWQKLTTELNGYRILKKVENTDLLQSITLISTYINRMRSKLAGVPDDKLPAVSCKRKEVLNLTLEEFNKYENQVRNGFIQAAKLLMENYVFTSDDLPYSSQLVPMSAIFGFLGDQANTIVAKEKLMKWYWCGVFGELYGGANETRYALDILQTIDWIKYNAVEPQTVYDANFNPARLHTLKTRNSAAYKGIYALLIKDGAQDFLNGKRIDLTTYFSENVDIHHIFPKKWCIDNGIPKRDYDCIVNKTPLSYYTNRAIGGDAPSKYIETLKRKMGADDDVIRKIIETHIIDPQHLWTDDFTRFFAHRKEQILRRIEAAMRKTIDREAPVFEPYIEETEEMENLNDMYLTLNMEEIQQN